MYVRILECETVGRGMCLSHLGVEEMHVWGDASTKSAALSKSLQDPIHVLLWPNKSETNVRRNLVF